MLSVKNIVLLYKAMIGAAVLPLYVVLMFASVLTHTVFIFMFLCHVRKVL
jgi:hypothetical protein